MHSKEFIEYMNFETIKSKIYYDEGQMKEIIVYDPSEASWQKWIDYINNSYKVQWYYSDDIIKNKIEFDRIKYFWNNPQENYQTFGFLYIDNIQIKIFFWEPEFLVHCFWPSDINTEKDHIKIIEYMKKISKVMENDVFLIDETQSYNKNYHFLLKITNDRIEYNV